MSKAKQLRNDYAKWLKNGELPILCPAAKVQFEKIFETWKKDGKDIAWVEKMKNAKQPKPIGGS